MKIMLRLSLFLLGLIVFILNAVLLVLRPANDEPYWIVYADSFGIQKVQVNGEGREEILPGSWTIYGVNKDWVYFSLDIPDPYATVMQIRLDGTDMQPFSRNGKSYKALAISGGGDIITWPVRPFGDPGENAHGTTQPVLYSTATKSWNAGEGEPGSRWNLTSPSGDWVLTYRLDQTAHPVIYKTGTRHGKVQSITRVDAFLTNPTPFWVPRTRLYNGLPLLPIGVLLMLVALAPRLVWSQCCKLPRYFRFQRLLPLRWQQGRPHRI